MMCELLDARWSPKYAALYETGVRSLSARNNNHQDRRCVTSLSGVSFDSYQRRNLFVMNRAYHLFCTAQ